MTQSPCGTGFHGPLKFFLSFMVSNVVFRDNPKPQSRTTRMSFIRIRIRLNYSGQGSRINTVHYSSFDLSEISH